MASSSGALALRARRVSGRGLVRHRGRARHGVSSRYARCASVRPVRIVDGIPKGSSAQPFVEGTVARELRVLETETFGGLREDDHLYTGQGQRRAGHDVSVRDHGGRPRSGQERFNIYCSPCHGRTGEGNGMVVQRGYRQPPSYHIDRLRQVPVGYLFDVITIGFGTMPDYSAQIPVEDRWRIVAYIRALQLRRTRRLPSFGRRHEATGGRQRAGALELRAQGRQGTSVTTTGSLSPERFFASVPPQTCRASARAASCSASLVWGWRRSDSPRRDSRCSFSRI